ncbi:hypothetical protein FOZ76_25330 [Verticiella sediminum]|uniref:UDP-N-acetylmuramate--alanine ligase n=1 Tax=Verticiella sediminum TaxID=1247510 RepID=A0A556A7U1_9BURK|nr:hypothetical protein [Verticiella sediminum]TSH88956.1 hypothetical protein FOZ76_25330 [Verticiella sediminum]
MALPNLRDEIAHAAARMIAEDGLDYSTAKRKAVRQLLGQSAPPRREYMPDNTEVEEALRDYLAIYMGDTQPQRLRELRESALGLMQWLESFQPYLTGAVWNGTAGEHSDIVLQCFTDSPKDVAIFLLNEGIDFDVEERPDFRGRGTVEAMHFERDGEGVVLAVYDHDALRGALKPGPDGRAERGDTRAVGQLLAVDEGQA